MFDDYPNHKEAFEDFLKALKMTKMSLEAWADSEERKLEVAGKLGTLESAIALGESIYISVKEKQEA